MGGCAPARSTGAEAGDQMWTSWCSSGGLRVPLGHIFTGKATGWLALLGPAGCGPLLCVDFRVGLIVAGAAESQSGSQWTAPFT